jgi:hypothetical protein
MHRKLSGKTIFRERLAASYKAETANNVACRSRSVSYVGSGVGRGVELLSCAYS